MIPVRRTVLWILLVCPTSLNGQDSDARALSPILGVHLLSTTVAAFEAGITHRPAGDEGPFVAGVAYGNVGLAGAQLGIGVGRYWPPAADYGGPGAEISLRVHAAVLRTWGDPRHVGPSQSFLGVELQGMFMLLGTRLGFFRRVGGTIPGEESFFTTGLVVGWQ